MATSSDIRKGLKIKINEDPYAVVSFQFVKPGKGQAYTRTKLKNLKTGQVLEKTFKGGDKLVQIDFEEKTAEYLYNDGEDYVFMDTATYEQFPIAQDKIGDAVEFLKENTRVTIQYYEGVPMAVELPPFIILEITEAEPGVKGDTATGATKRVTLETGAKINVPLFIEKGDRLKIDTRAGTYVERVK